MVNIANNIYDKQGTYRLERSKVMRANIIGTGISGLVMGAILAKNGYKVHLYEQNEDIGGVTGGFRKNGFSWDMGQLIIEGFESGEQAGKVIDELGLRDKIKLIRADRIYDFPDFVIKPPKDYEGIWWRKDFFLKQFPEEKRGIKKYYRYYRRMMAVISLARLGEKTKGFKSLLFKVAMYGKLLPLLPKAKWSAQKLMDYYFKGKEIKAAFTSILADFVVKPEEFQGLGVALVNPEPAFDRRVPLKLSKFASQPSYTFIDGGCRVLVDLLAEIIRSHKGTIHTDCEVMEIKTEDNKVIGLKLADGTFHECDIAVATGGAKETYGRLLADCKLTDDYQKIIDDLPLMESVILLQLGLDTDPSQYLESAVNYYYLTYEISGSVEKLKNGLYHEGEDGFLICNPTFYSPQSAPKGYYAITLYTVAPDNPSDFKWADKKEIMAEKLIDLAQTKIPGLKEHIVEMEIFTPEDFRGITLQQHHAFGGCAPVMNKKTVPYRTPVSGLWFIGSQSESGAGMNNVIEGAWRAADMIINNKEKK
jgi:phytoene dehydrogenase-like protein